jgi:four helix bundle protein
MVDRTKVPAAKLFAVEKLDVYRVALEFLVLHDRTAPRIWRRNQALFRQLQRAVASVIANIGEATSCFSPGDRRRYFEYAYRSAGECAALMIALNELGVLHGGEYDDARQLLHRIQIMLRRLMQQPTRPPPHT